MKNRFAFIYMLQLFFIASLFAGEVSEYKTESYCISYEDQEFKVIRSFKKDGDKKLLVVHGDTLQTYIFDNSSYKKVECSNSKYDNFLKISVKPPYPLTNDGISNFKVGVYLTVDLCPSSKRGYEREFFKTLIKRFPNPVPVTIFVTKRWMLKHKESFLELKRWDEEGKLDITWGNHTAYHFYKKGLPIEQNFVLCKHMHLKSDVLDLEKFLIENGVVPSVFFRFPGLVSNKKVINDIASLSLITIGSNSWIAKNQPPKEGSIVLVHGNKNEPLGVKLLVKYLKTKIKDVSSLKEGILFYQSKNKNSADRK